MSLNKFTKNNDIVENFLTDFKVEEVEVGIVVFVGIFNFIKIVRNFLSLVKLNLNLENFY